MQEVMACLRHYDMADENRSMGTAEWKKYMSWKCRLIPVCSVYVLIKRVISHFGSMYKHTKKWLIVPVWKIDLVIVAVFNVGHLVIIYC